MRANGSQEGFMENAPGLKDRVVVVTGARVAWADRSFSYDSLLRG
jgi:hypothetical protein